MPGISDKGYNSHVSLIFKEISYYTSPDKTTETQTLDKSASTDSCVVPFIEKTTRKDKTFTRSIVCVYESGSTTIAKRDFHRSSTRVR